MYTNNRGYARKARDADRFRLWQKENIPYCNENDIPEWVYERLMRYRSGFSRHESVFQLLTAMNGRWGKQAKWCLVGDMIYIDKKSTYKIIDFIKAHGYMPPSECDKWAEEMDDFFERSEDVDTD